MEYISFTYFNGLSSAAFCFLAAAAVRGIFGAAVVVVVGAALVVISLLIIAMVKNLIEKKTAAMGSWTRMGKVEKRLPVGKAKLEVVGGSTAPTATKRQQQKIGCWVHTTDMQSNAHARLS